MKYTKSSEKKKKECPLIIGRAGRGRARKNESENEKSVPLNSETTKRSELSGFKQSPVYSVRLNRQKIQADAIKRLDNRTDELILRNAQSAKTE